MRTYCRICEAACGLEAEVSGGELIALRPDRDHPVTKGFVCVKGTRFAQVAQHPERVIRPQRRDAEGRLADVSWDEANADIGARLRAIREAHGPHSVAFYFGNPTAFSATAAMAAPRFSKVLGSRNVFGAGSQDCNNKFKGSSLIHGSPFIHPLPDIEHAELVLMFGTNPLVSHLSFAHLGGGTKTLDEVVARGGAVVFVDPRRTESAERYEHVGIRPGADVFLLAALVNELRDGAPVVDASSRGFEGLSEILAFASRFPVKHAAELTGTPRVAIERLASRIRGAGGRVALHMGVGVNQGPFGTLAYVLLHALAVLSGGFDRRGGWVFHPGGKLLHRLAGRFIDTGRHRSRVGDFETVLDTFPAGVLADEILMPGPEKVRALICLAGNPVRSVPDGGRLSGALAELDLFVSIDLFETETSRHADYLLPVPSWLERADLNPVASLFGTHGSLPVTERVLAPPGDVRSEWRILGDLSEALGVPMFGPAPLHRLVSHADIDGLIGGAIRTMKQFGYHEGDRLWPALRPEPGDYLRGGSAHQDGAVRLWGEEIANEAERAAAYAAETREGALLLIGRRRTRGHNSWIRGASHDGDERFEAWLHPDDAAEHLEGDRGMIRVASEAGELELEARAHSSVERGTVVIPHGYEEGDVNALIPSGVGQIAYGGMHVMTGIPVRVVRV